VIDGVAKHPHNNVTHAIELIHPHRLAKTSMSPVPPSFASTFERPQATRRARENQRPSDRACLGDGGCGLLVRFSPVPALALSYLSFSFSFSNGSGPQVSGN
jgi:hypothetical protein